MMERHIIAFLAQAKHECELVWEAMQAELQRLLAEVLDAPSLTAAHGPGSSSGG
jgi:hypothetical protein